MVRPARPARTYETGRVTLWLRRVIVIATAALTVVVLARYPSLPETIPTHFTLLGEPDAHGPRSAVLLIAAILSALLAGMVWLSRKPRVFNYPLAVTEANAQSLYREGERMLVWTAAAVLLVYLGAIVAMFGGSSGVFMGAGVAAMFGALIAGVIRMTTVSVAATTDEPTSADTTRP